MIAHQAYLPSAIQKSATVGASALALHLDCSRTYIGKLEEGVIQRQGDGFPLIVAPGVKEDGAELPATSSLTEDSALFDLREPLIAMLQFL